MASLTTDATSIDWDKGFLQLQREKDPAVDEKLSHQLAEDQRLPSDVTSTATTQTDNLNLCEAYQYIFLLQLQTFEIPVLCILATVGNVGVVILFKLARRHETASQQEEQKGRGGAGTSFQVYSTAMLIACTVALNMGYGQEWLFYMVTPTHPVNKVDWICRVWQFLKRVVVYSPNWLAVAVAIDQYLALGHPRRAKALCGPFLAKAMIVSIFIGLVVTSVHSMWTFELTPHSGCSVDPYRRDYHTVVWPYISSTVTSYIPILGLLILAFMLGFQLFRTRSSRQTADTFTITLSMNNRKSTSQTPGKNALTVDPPSHLHHSPFPRHHLKTRKEIDHHPKLALCLALTFSSLQLPMLVVNIAQFAQKKLITSIDTQCRTGLALELALHMACLSYATIFVIYIAGVSSLRSQFKRSALYCWRACSGALSARRTASPEKITGAGGGGGGGVEMDSLMMTTTPPHVHMISVGKQDNGPVASL